jgi:hypothetical protein
MAARRIARNPSFRFRWITSFLMIRGAEGTWGERVRGRGGSAPCPPEVVAGLGVFSEQITDGYPVHRTPGRVRQGRHRGRSAGTHRSTARRGSGSHTLGID